jgi:hypothetical protein
MHEFHDLYTEMLKEKERLPVDYTNILSLNVNSLIPQFKSLLLATLRPRYLIEQLNFQESSSSGLCWPGFDSYESKPIYSSPNHNKQAAYSKNTARLVHGTCTYICNIKSHDLQIMSRQETDDWINAPNLSAVITSLVKKKSEAASKNQTMTSMNLYILCHGIGRAKDNHDVIEYIFAKFLPNAVKIYNEMLIFSDTNADFTAIKLNNSVLTLNDRKMQIFLEKNRRLIQLNEKYSNSSRQGCSRVIDYVLAPSEYECSVEYGGKAGKINFHPLLLTTVKLNSINESKNIDFNENNCNFNLINEVEVITARDWQILNHHSAIRETAENSEDFYLRIWRDNNLIKYETDGNSFKATCAICGWTQTTGVHFSRHFNKKHLQNYSDLCIKDLLWLLEQLNFKLE